MKQNIKIDTVIFDVGNVLYRWNLRCLFKKLIEDEDELEWFVTHVVTPEWHHQHDEGRPLAEMVPERVAEFPKYKKQIEAYAERFVETIPGPVEGSLEIVEKLAQRGASIFGITNFGAEFWVQFRPTASIFDHFQDIVVSGQEKLAKPDRAIYQLALKRFDRRAEQCLFVDDRPENIQAAEKLDIVGHIFRDAPTLERHLTMLELL